MYLNSLKYKKSLLSVFLLTFFIVVFLSSYKAVSFFNFYSFSTKPIISNYNIVQHPLISGGPIQWVKYVQVGSVNNSAHLLAIPESATNIKIFSQKNKE